MTEIITLADDEKITDPAGAYQMSMDLYHSQRVCPGPSISSSGLRTIFMQSPWHFWADSELNPNRYPQKETGDGLVLGRATHALVLGDEVFDEHFIYVPEDAPRRPTAPQIAAFERNGFWSDAAKDGAEFWTAFDERAKGRMMLSHEQVQKIKYMSENLAKSPPAVEALRSRMTEVSMIWQDEQTGVWLKSRPDTIPDNGADFGDLKTFAPQMKDIKRAAQRAITDYRYDMQMALAVMGAEACFGSTATNCVLVLAQTTAPYTVTPVRIDEDTLYWARVCCRQAIDTFAECLKSGHWPQPIEDIMNYTLPDSMLHRYAELQANGQLPSMER